MNNDTLDFAPSLPDHLRERTRALNTRPVEKNGAFVLYWMHHAARGHHNPALDAAIFTANRLDLPVLVYQGLGGRHPYNSDRHHTFILEGAREVQRELAERGIAYCFHLPTDPAAATPLKALMERAALTITEDFPAPPFNAWSSRLARTSSSTFWVVDTACLLPLQDMAVYHDRAYQFRDAARLEYKKRTVQPYRDLQSTTGVFQGHLGFDGLDLASADIADLCARCRIDHTVGPVAHTRGGASSGYRRWEVFKQHGLASYADMRNDAAAAFPLGVSRMSAYLHHGHVSPFRIARQAALAGGPGARKFLDELLIWRELAHHFCFHHAAPGTLGALPAWAMQTLEDHRQDRRKVIFDWDALSRARTGDPLWDAAQRSLIIHGELHNNVRMTWGKAILQWTRSPEEALQTMIALNHRYALDGNDPNSYGGILWCMGLFDRAFHPEKPVIGTLRPALHPFSCQTPSPGRLHRQDGAAVQSTSTAHQCGRGGNIWTHRRPHAGRSRSCGHCF
jgi:photolyase PhrII